MRFDSYVYFLLCTKVCEPLSMVPERKFYLKKLIDN
jgi:hypothetical protein